MFSCTNSVLSRSLACFRHCEDEVAVTSKPRRPPHILPPITLMVSTSVTKPPHNIPTSGCPSVVPHVCRSSHHTITFLCLTPNVKSQPITFLIIPLFLLILVHLFQTSLESPSSLSPRLMATHNAPTRRPAPSPPGATRRVTKHHR